MYYNLPIYKQNVFRATVQGGAGGGGNTIYKLGTIRKRKFNEFERTHCNNETGCVLSNGVFCNKKNCFVSHKRSTDGIDTSIEHEKTTRTCNVGRAKSAYRIMQNPV